jgi:hypothetical protein
MLNDAKPGNEERAPKTSDAPLCELRAANGIEGADCDEERCLYWRFAEAVCDEESGLGCAIQHFSMLDGGEVARWLLSVKERVEAEAAKGRAGTDAEKSSDPG